MKVPFFRSLRFKIPLLVLAGVVPPVMIAMGFASSNATKVIREDIKDKLALEAKGLATSISQWNQMNALALQNLSKQPGMVSLDVKQQKPLLEQIVKTYNHLYIAHTTDLNGNNIARSDNQPPNQYPERLWLKGAKAGNEITYQTLIGKTSKKPSLCISTPIRQQQTISAVAIICSILDEVAERVAAVKIGETGYALIVDELGQVLAHPNSALTSGDNLTDFSNYPPVQNLLAGNEGYFTFTDETGTEWVAHGTRLNNGWGAVILQEKAEAFLAEREFQQGAIALIVLLIAAVSFLTWLLANNLAQPITQLTDAASDLAAGKLDQKIDIKRQDELGILASSFDRMAQQLAESFNSLSDRTSELNHLLESQNQAEQQQREAQKKLQQQVRSLQRQLESVNQGDLTVRATVTPDEIGKDASPESNSGRRSQAAEETSAVAASACAVRQIASSYNATIENLRKIVAQVQLATQTVTVTTNYNETAVSELSTGALQQTMEIAAILDRMQTMAKSMQTVAVDAERADKSIKQATEKAKIGDEAIKQTVRRITGLGQTASETTEQAKRLGKASRKISKAIGLIRKIALQTNVLAVNASIEAARAGDEGLGFTVVADEVQALATQSAQAATDIEKLVSEIQLETHKVIKAMEISNQEVMAGSQDVEEVRIALQQVAVANQEIDRLIEAVATVITEQSQTSQSLTETMEEVAAIASKTSASAGDVSDSFKELLTVAKQLENSIGRFKVS